MNNMIVVDYDPFVMESSVYALVNGVQTTVRVASNPQKLAKELTRFAYELGCDTIKVNADATTLTELRQRIKEVESTNYSNNKIVVEGL